MPGNARSASASIASNTRWAFEPDRTAATQAARTAFMQRFERQVDPDGLLSPAERARRAENLRRAHFARLALKSAESRRRKRSAAEDRAIAAELRAAADSLEGGEVA